jgi:hypothetical protein
MERRRQQSLTSYVAPAFFSMDPDTGYIKFPEAVRTVVLDVGARDSDYLTRLGQVEDHGVGLILFDPLPHSYIPVARGAAEYQMRNTTDGRWLDRNYMDSVFTVRAALAEEEGTTSFNVGIGPACSSLLEFVEFNATPHWCMVSTGKIGALTLRLENILRLIPPAIGEVHLKVDAEGMDLRVLKGGGSQLGRLATVLIESCTYPTRGEVPPGTFNASDASDFMDGAGFREVYPPSQPHGQNQFWVRRNWTLPLGGMPPFLTSGVLFSAFYSHVESIEDS